MNGSRRWAISMAALLLTCGAALVLYRGGLLAWSGAIVGATLLAKASWRPSRMDLWVGLAATGLWAAVWIGTARWVISTWESGEVVELAIDTAAGSHTARVWVLDVDGAEVVVYDAGPGVADALRSDRPVRLKRGDVVRSTSVEVRSIDDVDPSEAERLFSLMGDKYGDRNTATDVFYTVLGRPRDRVILILRLAP